MFDDNLCWRASNKVHQNRSIKSLFSQTSYNQIDIIIPSSAKTLMISFIGMKTVEVAVAPSLSIYLKTDAEVLDEVMVVAFGTAKKSQVTGSAATIGGE